jgi:hypothetical protein
MSGTTDAPTQAAPKRQAPRERKPLAYEGAGPERLSRTPGIAKKRQPGPTYWPTIKSHCEARLNYMRSVRQSWMEHYALLESYILPRRGIFINSAQPTANLLIKGLPINQNILDPTGTYAMRRCAAGIMSNEMSPSRQWFKLKPALFDRENAPDEAVEWFEEVEDRMDTVMARSNFYQEAAQLFEDLCTFGTGPMLIYEDDEDLIRCYTPCCGEYFVSSSSANRVETFGRLFVMTISAIVEMFGLENCPPDVQGMWRDKGGALEVERLVAHMIEPNAPILTPGGGPNAGVVPGGFAWREAYWIWGGEASYPLSLAGFHEAPHLVPRWAVTSNDAYGRSVGMDVLPDIIQLQVETARKAEAIEKMVRPPMLASLEMKNEPASILPGKVTYVNGLGADKGMRPAFTVNPEIREMMLDISAVQLRVREGFLNDLFASLEQITKQMTAYEVAARNQEKLQILGPVVERLQNECLAPAIKRVFRIMERKGVLPPLPPSLHGVPLGIEYVGILSLSQKAAKTASLERFAQTMDTLQQIHPEAGDCWNLDKWCSEYGSDLFLPKDILRSPQEIAQIRDQRAKQQQAQQAIATAQQASQIGKNLGDISVGGGMNAVQAMTGLGGDVGGGAPQQGSG